MCHTARNTWTFGYSMKCLRNSWLEFNWIICNRNCIRESQDHSQVLEVLQVEISWKWERTPPSSASNTWTENNGYNYHHQLLSHLIWSDLVWSNNWSIMSVRRSSSSCPVLEQWRILEYKTAPPATTSLSSSWFNWRSISSWVINL